MKNNEEMIIGKFLIIFGLLLQLWRVIIPACAYAQTYEEAELNNDIIEALMDEDFRLDAETNLWKYEGVEEDDEGYGDIVATFNIYYNTGHMEYKYYVYDKDHTNHLAAEATADFKYYPQDNRFGMTKFNLTEYEETSIGVWIKMF